MERLLITGSEGQIGSILQKALDDQYEVYCLDQVKKDSIRYSQIDIAKLGPMQRVFQTVNPEFVIHLAADSRVDAPWESVLQNNIIGTKNLYSCARLLGVKRVIFASSNHVTGGYENNLHSELITVNVPIRPDSDYGTSKYFGEGLARQYYDLYGIESICLRIGTVTSADNPQLDTTGRMMRTWLSHRDLIQLVQKSLAAPTSFGIYYGVSGNESRIWDISNAQKDLGYQPLDNAATR